MESASVLLNRSDSKALSADEELDEELLPVNSSSRLADVFSAEELFDSSVEMSVDELLVLLALLPDIIDAYCVIIELKLSIVPIRTSFPDQNPCEYSAISRLDIDIQRAADASIKACRAAGG